MITFKVAEGGSKNNGKAVSMGSCAHDKREYGRLSSWVEA